MTVIRGSPAGFTVVELSIGMAIMSIILVAVLLTQHSAQRLISHETESESLDQKAHRVVEAVASDIRWADKTSLLVTQDNGSDRLDLRTPTGFADHETVWSTVITYRIVPSNVDADKNGVLDEGRLVRIQDGVARTLCDQVVAGGFLATMVDDNVRIRLSLVGRDSPSDVLQATHAQTSISLRN